MLLEWNMLENFGLLKWKYENLKIFFCDQFKFRSIKIEIFFIGISEEFLNEVDGLKKEFEMKDFGIIKYCYIFIN